MKTRLLVLPIAFILGTQVWSQTPIQQAYLKNLPLAQGLAGARFGAAVGVDRNLAVVGSPNEYGGGIGVNGIHPSSAAFSGAASVFQREGASWVPTAFLKASNTDAYDYFGSSAALSGDTIVIGAPGEDSVAGGAPFANPSSDQGAAYVFHRDPVTGTWSQQGFLKASDGAGSFNFGSSVAVDGERVAVGAPGANGNAGAVYVFRRDSGAWTQEAKLVALNTSGGHSFGRCVDLSGDSVLVGAPYEQGSATTVNGTPDNLQYSAGAAYVFTRSMTTGSWSQQAYLKPPNTQSGDDFGSSVSLSGDVAVVGAPREDSGATGVGGAIHNESAADSGAAYVFRRSAGVWVQEAYLKASNTQAGDRFGSAVAVDGEVVLVAATRESSNATGADGDPNNDSASRSGAVYRFSRNAGAWSGTGYLKASNTDANDSFGAAETYGGYPTGSGLALSGSTAVIGAQLEDGNARGVGGDQGDNSATDAGAAYVIDNIATPVPDLAVDGPDDGYLTSGESSVNFGLAFIGGDSQRELTIRNNGSGDLTPITFAFTGPDAAAFSLAAVPVVPVGPGVRQTFRIRFAPTVLGGRSAQLVINTNDPDQGQYAIWLHGTGVSLVRNAENPEAFRIRPAGYIKASNTDDHDHFGRSVAISGNTMVIGAPDEDSPVAGVSNLPDAVPAHESNTASDSGAAYVFVRDASGGWTQQAYLKAANPGAGDQFGIRVAIDGDIIVVGAWEEDGGATGSNAPYDDSVPDAGAAYVFVRDANGSWSQEAYLKSQHTGPGVPSGDFLGQYFGTAVKVSGDTVIVHAVRESASTVGLPGAVGVVYVYRRFGLPLGGFGWLLEARLVPPPEWGNDVIFSGMDIFGNHIAIGVPGTASFNGAIVIYKRTGNTWVRETDILSEINDRIFGRRVSLDGAGVRETLLAEAGGWAPVVYSQTSPGVWTREAEIRPTPSNLWRNPTPFGGINFGSSMDLHGNTIIVGAASESSDALGVNVPAGSFPRNASGAAFVFNRQPDTGAWVQTAVLKAFNADPLDFFGSEVAIDSGWAVVGAHPESSWARGVNGTGGSGSGFDNEGPESGAAYVFRGLDPEAEIGITRTASGENVAMRSSVGFGMVPPGSTRTIEFTVTNHGDANLSISAFPLPPITMVGDVGQFIVTSQPSGPVSPGETTTFSISFSPTGTGTRNATITLGSSDADEESFIIHLTGYSPAPTDDLDGDGIPDGSEFDLEAAGFRAGQNDSARADTIVEHAEFFDLYAPTDMQALLVETPLIFRNPVTGEVTLTLGVSRATDLSEFAALPATAPQVTVNPQGKIEFRLPSPDPRVFFRIDAR